MLDSSIIRKILCPESLHLPSGKMKPVFRMKAIPLPSPSTDPTRERCSLLYSPSYRLPESSQRCLLQSCVQSAKAHSRHKIAEDSVAQTFREMEYQGSGIERRKIFAASGISGSRDSFSRSNGTANIRSSLKSS